MGYTPLILASENGHDEVVKLLLKEEHIDVNKAGSDYTTALYTAVENGHSSIVQMLLQDEDIDANKVGHPRGTNPLIRATQAGIFDIVQMLLHVENIDVNHAEKSNMTALLYASSNGRVEIVQALLLIDNIDVNIAWMFGETPLLLASSKGYTEIVRLLLNNKDIDVNKGGKTGWQYGMEFTGNALILASQYGKTDVVLLLLEKEGIDVNIASDDGKTALYWASYYGHADMVKHLLFKPEIELNRKYGNETILWISSYQGQAEIVQMLLEHPKTDIMRGISADEDITPKVTDLIFNKDTRSSENIYRIFCATLLGNITQVSALLQQDETLLNSYDSLSRTLLFWASTRGYIDLVENILNKTSTLINKRRMNNDASPLYQAAKYGHLKIVNLLLKHSTAQVNMPTLDRETPLMASTFNGHYEVVAKLLSVTNIDVNYATFDSKTALIYAVLVKNPFILELLLRCPQTDISIMDEGYEYKTALDIAHQRNMALAVELFNSRGHLQTKKGHTCCSKFVDRGLHTAIRIEDAMWINTFLLCPDLKINVRNKDGETPLNLAVEKGLTSFVETFLADQRIEVNKPNTGGRQNALVIATKMGNTALLKLILRHNQTAVNQLNANKESALQIALKKYDEKGQRKYFTIIKVLLRCPKTEVKNDSSYASNIQQAIELRSVSTEFKPTCCLNVRESLVGAALVGDFRAIRGLLDCPGTEGNVNALDIRGRPPLYIAATMGHIEAVKVLLKNSYVDVNFGTRVDGGTPFSIASERSSFDVMKVLILGGNTDEGKGWCIDNWTKPCVHIRDSPMLNKTLTPLVPSSEFY